MGLKPSLCANGSWRSWQRPEQAATTEKGRAVDFEFLADEGVIDAEDRELFWFAETANEIWTSIQNWYDAFGAPLGLKA